MPKTKLQRWEDIISNQLVGRKIVEIRWMTQKEAKESLWDYQPVILILDDGTSIFPMSDDEGNSAGSLYHCGAEQSTIPVMRY